MENNIFFELLFKGVDNPKHLTVDNIETLLGRITDLHNTMGKSYEYLVDVISILLTTVNQNRSDKSLSKVKDSEVEIKGLKDQINGLVEELDRVGMRAVRLEKECQEKDKIIDELQRKLENKTDNMLLKSSNDNPLITEEENVGLFNVKQYNEENLVSELRVAQRGFEQSGMAMAMEEEEEKNEMEEKNDNLVMLQDDNGNKMNYDLFKFKKNLKKLKSTDCNLVQTNNITTPCIAAFNGKRNGEFSLGISNQIKKLDEDGSLNNLLNNFIRDKGSPLKPFMSNKFVTVAKKENDIAPDNKKDFGFYQVNKPNKIDDQEKGTIFGQKNGYKMTGLFDKSNLEACKKPIIKQTDSANLIQKMLLKKNSTNVLDDLLKESPEKEEYIEKSGIEATYTNFKDFLYKRKPDQDDLEDFT